MLATCTHTHIHDHTCILIAHTSGMTWRVCVQVVDVCVRARMHVRACVVRACVVRAAAATHVISVAKKCPVVVVILILIFN